MKLLIPRARQAVGRCLADQQLCSLCLKDLNYTEISAWSVVGCPRCAADPLWTGLLPEQEEGAGAQRAP